MKVTQFNKPTLRAMRADIDAALAKVGKKYGVDLSSGNARFSATNFTMKLEASLLSDDGAVMTKEAKELQTMYGISGVNYKYGDTFVQNGKTYKIVGYTSRRPKFPISAVRVDTGRTYKFPRTVNRHFG